MLHTGDQVRHRLDGFTGSIQHFEVHGRTCSARRAEAHPLGCVVVWTDGAGESVTWAIRDCRWIKPPMLTAAEAVQLRWEA